MEKRLGDILEQSVTIKGTKGGIILVLDPSISFDELAPLIAEKFRDASSFLGKHDMGLLVRGRDLSEEEMDTVVSIIHENSKLHISAILDEKPEVEDIFNSTPIPEEKTESHTTLNTSGREMFGDEAIIYKGNLRSGQDISSEKSVVILGDVKPGANVTSYGSIYILGELRGNAFAGAGGDESAVIMALDLDPIQLRIAGSIAISPDAEKGAKIKVKKKRFMAPADNDPEVAYIENGHIVKTSYGASFLKRFFKI